MQDDDLSLYAKSFDPT